MKNFFNVRTVFMLKEYCVGVFKCHYVCVRHKASQNVCIIWQSCCVSSSTTEKVCHFARQLNA